MRLYPLIHSLNRTFPLAVFWLYVGMFILAFAMIFVFPFAPLLLLGLALAGLVVVIPFAKLLRILQEFVARTSMHRGVCPACGKRATGALPDVGGFDCADCGKCFTTGGRELAPGDEAPAVHA